MNEGLRFSQSESWRTPVAVFAPLNREFGFTCDVCASPENALCEKFYTIEDNALSKEWTGVCWCNPPFDMESIAAFVGKAYTEARRGNATTVLLLPAKVDQQWFHDYGMKATEIRFIRKRVNYAAYSSDQKNSPAFSSFLLVFKSRQVDVGAPTVKSQSQTLLCEVAA